MDPKLQQQPLEEAWQQHQQEMEHALRFHEGDHSLEILLSFDDGQFDALAEEADL